MPSNLRTRLGRIRGGSHGGGKRGEKSGSPPEAPRAVGVQSAASWPGWTEAGFKTLKRTFFRELPFPLPAAFPQALAILVPDLARMGRIPDPQDLLFFDLETTGLSGGAGTVAFLAAFGRFAGSAGLPPRIEITQYLLLDYPGETDFIEKAAAELRPKECSAPPLVVSFNGKSFDSQILKSRCLMNGIMPPEYLHADLLHPARRLWRRQLTDCSQATIEVSVLGLDRGGDVSGALAPEIWFSFLRSGENRDLLAICEHNTKDILGLASLFLGLGEIAAAPLETLRAFRVDEEALALLWRKALNTYPVFFREEKAAGELLLKNAACNGWPYAATVMAKNAEWHLGDPALALAYTARALNAPGVPESLRKQLEKRRARLEEKIARKC
ncbi:MAG: ribonuclease H-like domain-containing protein [Treponema sp.]|nr:ribonuclease H-like domain-containing protein [Treponema sp.]